ncbi:hypothetical protein BDB01DRAFT_845146 [Pilobolus umbonatus]|nr:hypothetical protein BDB01DRAFT_845146 [Pilobolus umbonatus]
MSTKRKRSTNASNFKVIRQTIRTLEAESSDTSHLNNIVKLSTYAKDSNPQVAHCAIHALHRVFTGLLMKGDLDRLKLMDASSAKHKVQVWLREHYLEYIQYVTGLLESDEPGLQIPSLNILMSIVKSESEHAKERTKNYHFANEFYGPVVKSLVLNKNLNDHLKREVIDKYINVYDDLRHYFYKNTASVIERLLEQEEPSSSSRSAKKIKLAESSDLSRIAKNALDLVDGIRTMPTEESEIDEFWTSYPTMEGETDNKTLSDDAMLLGEGLLSEEEEEAEDNKQPKKKKKRSPLLQLRVHQRGFTDCWIQVMKLPLTNDMYKHILLSLHKRILPHLTEPRLLMDFLTDSYNVGGAISLLALNGLFTLITQHGL